MRSLLKRVLNLISWVLVAWLAFPIRWAQKLDKSYRFFQFGSQLMSLVPGVPGVYLRRQYYRIVFRLSSGGFVIEFGTIFAMPGTRIGDNAYVGASCNIGLADIANDVLLGSNVDVIAGPKVHHFDRVDIPIRLQGGDLKLIEIGEGTWVGNGAIVLADIEKECVVGAGSVVVKPCNEPFGIYAGNPAKLIRSRI